jgi:hypothetical protein
VFPNLSTLLKETITWFLEIGREIVVFPMILMSDSIELVFKEKRSKVVTWSPLRSSGLEIKVPLFVPFW